MFGLLEQGAFVWYLHRAKVLLLCFVFKDQAGCRNQRKTSTRHCLVDRINNLQHSYALQTVEYFTPHIQSHRCCVRLNQHVC